jgi:hypothetical protein
MENNFFSSFRIRIAVNHSAKSVVLTFDDVTENQLLCLSFTEKYNLKATFFIQYIGKADLWNQGKKKSCQFKT